MMPHSPQTSKKAPVFQKKTATTIFSCAARTVNSSTVGGYIEIFRMLSGEVRLTAAGRTKTLHAGETALFNPYEEKSAEYVTDSLIQSFVFDSPRYFDDIGIPPLNRFQNFCGADETLRGLCEAIEEEYANQSFFHESMLIALTTRLVIHLYRHYNAGPHDAFSDIPAGKQKIVRDALAFIYENCRLGLSTRDIAAHVCVNVSYLCRCFREVCGVSPLDFSERVRCRKAHEDLSLGIYSVGAVAEKYNFSSLSYFNRRYKKFYNTTPAATLAEARVRHAGEQDRE